VIDTESGKLEIIRKVNKILAKYETDKYYTFYVIDVFSSNRSVPGEPSLHDDS